MKEGESESESERRMKREGGGRMWVVEGEGEGGLWRWRGCSSCRAVQKSISGVNVAASLSGALRLWPSLSVGV